MNDMSDRFLALWQECYNAAFYALRRNRRWGMLYDAAALEKEIHRQVWTERFGNALVQHPASLFLDELQLCDLETAILVRSRVRGFKPKVGINAGLFKALLIVAAVLLLLRFALTFFLPALPLRLVLTILLLGLAGVCGWMLTRSLRAPEDLKQAFEAEKQTILKHLETLR